MMEAAHRAILAVRASRTRARLQDLEGRAAEREAELARLHALIKDKRDELRAIEYQLREYADGR